MHSKNQAILFMIICTILWSTGGFLIKVIPWNPLAIAGVRSLISAVIFILYMKHEKMNFVINKYSIIGGLSLSITFIFFIAANKLTTAANAIVLQSSAPVFVLIISAIYFKQKFRNMDFITVLATSMGISLFFFGKLSGGYLLGNILALMAGFTFATMFVTTGRADEHSRASGILLCHLFTAVIGIPFVFIYSTPISTPIVAAVLALGIFQIGIPYILYGIAARRCSPLACSLIGTIEPILNPIWVFFYNGEIPGFYAFIGGAVVISAVVSWTILSNKKEKIQTA